MKIGLVLDCEDPEALARFATIAAERERMAEWLITYHRNADELKREEEKRDGKSG